MNLIKKGSADITRYIMLVDSTAGTPETGYTITDLDLQYTRNRTAPVAKVDAVALAATDTAHTDNRAIQIDATSSPGLYRVDWPDAAFATGVDKVILVVSGTGLHPASEEIQLVNFDPEDGVRLGLTALPNAAADAAGGLPISDAGGLNLDLIPTKLDVIDDFLDTEIAAIKAKTDNLPADPATATSQSSIIGKLDVIDDFLDTEVVAIKAVTDKLDTTFVIDGAVYQFTANALELGPAGGGGGDATIANQTTIISALGVIDDFLDTEVAAIKAKTDLIPAAPASTTNITAGTITTVTNLTNAPTAGDLTATMKTSVQTAAEAGLVTHRLDELLNADSDIDGAAPPTVGSVFHELMTKTTGSFTFDQTTDSLEAIKDAGSAGLDAAGVRAAVGLAAANLDTQLDALPTNAELATALGTADDAILSAIAALNNLSQANVRTAVGLAAANLDTQLATLATPAQVNTEVVDALATDTYAEPGQGTPAATLSLAGKINYLFKNWRNKKTQTSTQWSLLNDDAVTVDQKSVVADDGVTASKNEVATGP